ncbi:MAG: hypothetical protein IMZ53_02740 [Thermoplasmata archaeon]|nr:hypothetical protein [Thermoplasmata archaeon]
MSQWKCQWCGTWNDKFATECSNSNCKSNLRTWRNWKCNYCGTWNDDNRDRCTKCGTERKGDEVSNK